MGPRASLDRCGKSCSHRDSIPGPSSPKLVAIPTMLPGPHVHQGLVQKTSLLALSALTVQQSSQHQWTVLPQVTPLAAARPSGDTVVAYFDKLPVH